MKNHRYPQFSLLKKKENENLNLKKEGGGAGKGAPSDLQIFQITPFRRVF